MSGVAPQGFRTLQRGFRDFSLLSALHAGRVQLAQPNNPLQSFSSGVSLRFGRCRL